MSHPTWRVILAGASTLIEVMGSAGSTVYAVYFDSRWPPRFDRLIGPVIPQRELLELRADVLSSLHRECPWPSAEEITESVRKEIAADRKGTENSGATKCE